MESFCFYEFNGQVASFNLVGSICNFLLFEDTTTIHMKF